MDSDCSGDSTSVGTESNTSRKLTLWKRYVYTNSDRRTPSSVMATRFALDLLSHSGLLQHLGWSGVATGYT